MIESQFLGSALKDERKQELNCKILKFVLIT